MARRALFLVDALLVLAMVVLALRVYELWTATLAVAVPPPPPAGARPAPPDRMAPPVRPPLSAFAVVAEQNLFSPTRNETGPTPPTRPATTAPAPAAPKPRLYGVVLGPDGTARAYLEDPRTRKVFGYMVGDMVAESRVEEIRADRVRLRRGGEVYEVLLRDPSKPTPPPPPVAPPAAATPVPGRARPGLPPVPGSRAFPLVPVPPGAPAEAPTGEAAESEREAPATSGPASSQ